MRSDTSHPRLNLAYEPLPTPMSLAELEGTDPYESSAQIYDSFPLPMDEEGRFEQTVTLNYKDQPGLYHIRIWVEAPFGKVLAVDRVIIVP